MGYHQPPGACQNSLSVVEFFSTGFTLLQVEEPVALTP